MLTLLSQKIRRLVDAALGRSEQGSSASAPNPSASAATSAAATRPGLRLVRAGEQSPATSDISIRVAAGSSIGAAAFVAGSGARLYSLDAFRKTRHENRPGPDTPATPRPHAA
jgi:hypothetical protein